MRKAAIVLLVCLQSLAVWAQVIDTDKVMLIGRNAMNYEDYVLAIQYFNRVIKAKPNLYEPYFYRGIAKFLLAEYRGAEEDFTHCLSIHPYITDAYLNRGVARFHLKEYHLALADFEKVMQETQNDRYLQLQMGICCLEIKEYENAKAIFNEVVEKNPEFRTGYLTRAYLQTAKGDTLAAIADLTKAIELDSMPFDAYARRGSLFYQTEKYEPALADFNRAIQRDSLVPELFLNRSLIHYQLDEYIEAKNDLDRSITLDSLNLIGRFNRALLLVRVGDDINALTDLNIVLQLEPDNNIALFNRAIIKGNMAEYKSAIEDINQVLKFHPDFYQAYFYRSEYRRKSGDTKGANADFRKAQQEEKRIARAILQGKDPHRTRTEEDKSIEKYDMLVVADNAQTDKNKYSNAARGKVQDNKINLTLQPLFLLTFHLNYNEVKNYVHASTYIDAMNRGNRMPTTLYISNDFANLNEDEIKSAFAQVTNLDKKLEKNATDCPTRLALAVAYMDVKDWDNAIGTLNKLLETEPNNILALFCMGAVYAQKYELEKKETEDNQSIIALTRKVKQNPEKNIAADQPDDYDRSLLYLNKLLKTDSKFIYAYYTRAALKALQENYREAIIDYNSVIDLNEEFADAYFNRGLCRLRLGDRKKAIEDFRTAAANGVVEAFGLIKKLSEME